MTKKDFIALAAYLAVERPERENVEAYNQWSDDIAAVASACVKCGPNFRWNLFIAACRKGEK